MVSILIAISPFARIWFAASLNIGKHSVINTQRLLISHSDKAFCTTDLRILKRLRDCSISFLYFHLLIWSAKPSRCPREMLQTATVCMEMLKLSWLSDFWLLWSLQNFICRLIFDNTSCVYRVWKFHKVSGHQFPYTYCICPCTDRV